MYNYNVRAPSNYGDFEKLAPEWVEDFFKEEKWVPLGLKGIYQDTCQEDVAVKGQAEEIMKKLSKKFHQGALVTNTFSMILQAKH